MKEAGTEGASFLGPLARAQYSAVAAMRWRILVNSLRRRSGKFELVAQIFWTGFFAIVGMAIGAGCGVIAHELAVDRQLALLPVLLWPVLLMWQTVPVMLAAAQEDLDFHFLLRFPVSFRSYVALYLCYGVFDPSSILGGIALLGIWIGVAVARPDLALWTAFALVLFAVFNFLLTRTIFAWIERWLAQRKTREVLGIVFLLLFLGLELLNPAFHTRSGYAKSIKRPVLLQVWKTIQTVQGAFPPGLAAKSIEMAEKSQAPAAVAALAGVAAYEAAIGLLLGLRLRAEYRGESLGEAPRAAAKGANLRLRPVVPPQTRERSWLHGWPDGPISGPVAAILAKELRYLSRSGVMLFTMLAPLVFLFLFGGTARDQHLRAVQYAFPIGVAYAFLPLTRQVCNSLGGEGAGIQLYFLAPTPFRTVLLGKNLLQLGIFLVELTIACGILVARFGPPPPLLAMTTLCWLLFALPANIAAGNLLSITMPYRMTMTRVSREQGSTANGLLSLLIQLLLIATGAAVYLPLALTGRAALAAPIFLLLACGAMTVWLRVLANVDRLASERREALIAALVRSA